MSDPSEISYMMPCAVFWDAVQFPFPDGLGPDLISEKIKSFLENEGSNGALSIKAYVDDENFPDELVKVYREAGITILTLEGNKSESARVHSMLVDIALWALENPASYFKPRNLIVVSEKIKEETLFLSALEALKYRYYNVLLVQTHPLSSTKLRTVSFDWLWSSISLGGSLEKIFVDHEPKTKTWGLPFSESLDYVYYKDFTLLETKVFCDVERFPANDTDNLVPNIRACLDKKGYHCDVAIRAYIDKETTKEKLKCHLFDDLWDLILVPEGDEYAKVTRMLLDILFWAMNSNIPRNLMVFLEYTKWSKRWSNLVLEALKRKSYNIILQPCESESEVQPLTQYLDFYTTSIEDNIQAYQYNTQASQYGICEQACSSDKIIFLDIEDWPVIDTRLFHSTITSTLHRQGYKDCYLSISAYASEKDTDEKLIREYEKSCFRVLRVPPGESGNVTSMLMDMIFLAGNAARLGRSTSFWIISKPVKNDKLRGYLERNLDYFEKELGIGAKFGLPDYLWITMGGTSWSSRKLFEDYESCRCVL